MARVKVHLSDRNEWLPETFDSGGLTQKSGSRAVYHDEEDQTFVTLRGTGFKFDGETIRSAVISKIEYRDEDGNLLGVIGDFEQKARDLASYEIKDFVLRKVMRGDDLITGSAKSEMLQGGRGNDTIVGLNGDDGISGGRGNDRMTGKLGSDDFYISRGDGRDVITDFDATGGGDDQDYLRLSGIDDYTIRSKGNDTIVDFGAGDKVVLKGVSLYDLSVEDIVITSWAL